MAISYQFIGLSFFPILVALGTLWFKVEDAATHVQLLFVSVLSFIAFLGTFKLIPPVSELCVKADLWGKDINKGGDGKVPESMGIVVGTVYLVVVIMFQPIFASMLGEYNAALTSICFMILLGFADDVLDLRWSIKISLSLLATLPILVSYSGPTLIIIPKPLRFLLGFSANFGVLYHLFMSLMAVFCTNSINILAGINGLEVGQSLVIGFSVLIHCSIQFVFVEANESTLLAIFLIVPFIAVSLALWYYNRHPSKVFVGDTYTYFAGMTLAVVATLGHFSKTLMLFFIPQLINFAISLPQLFGFIPCPRHRLPKLNIKTGKLECVKTNWNLLNLALYILGPTSEKDLCTKILAFHVFCSGVAFFIRYYLASFFY